METIEKKESSKQWKTTGRFVLDKRVCPDCFHQDREGFVKEYSKEKNGVKRYAYRCEQKVKGGGVCGATVEVSDFEHAQGDLVISVSDIMERGYLGHKTQTTKDEDFSRKEN